MKKFDVIKKILREDVPTNAVAGGQIAGTAEAGDDPVIRKRKQIIANLRRNVSKKLYGDQK